MQQIIHICYKTIVLSTIKENTNVIRENKEEQTDLMRFGEASLRQKQQLAAVSKTCESKPGKNEGVEYEGRRQVPGWALSVQVQTLEKLRGPQCRGIL